MRAAWLAGALLLAGPSLAQSVLNNSAHAADRIAPAVVAVLGAGHVDVDIFVDKTDLASSAHTDIVALATNTVRTNFSVASGASVNHAPYPIVSSSFSGYTSQVDYSNYAAAIAGGIVNNWAYVPLQTLPVGTPPPVSAVTVIHTIGASGHGVEFGISASYKGLNTSTPSDTAALMAGLLAAMRHQHPTWTWGDIKGALRQTAGNWATGYNSATFGYGTVDYDAAVAVASASAIYLQPPAMDVSVNATNGALTLTLYPFRQTRRSFEVVYLVPASYSFTLGNELTTSAITASGGILVYTSNGTDVIPTTTVRLQPGQFSGVYAGAWNLIAFTADGSGGFSRVESFGKIGLTLAAQCAIS